MVFWNACWKQPELHHRNGQMRRQNLCSPRIWLRLGAATWFSGSNKSTRPAPSSDSRSSRRAAGLPPPTPAFQAPKHTAFLTADPALARTEPGRSGGGGGGSNHHLGHYGSTCLSQSSGGRQAARRSARPPRSAAEATRRKGSG